MSKNFSLLNEPLSKRLMDSLYGGLDCELDCQLSPKLEWQLRLKLMGLMQNPIRWQLHDKIDRLTEKTSLYNTEHE